MKPITIEQSSEEAKLAFDVHRHAPLNSIRLADATIRSCHPSELEGSTVKLDFAFHAERTAAPEGVLRILVRFRTTATMENDAKPKRRRRSGRDISDGALQVEPCVVAEVGFEADYSLNDGYLPEPDAVEAFQQGNAIFNVWPYFREFLQSATTRMGHPPLTAPFLKLTTTLGEKSVSENRESMVSLDPQPPRKRKAANRRNAT